MLTAYIKMKTNNKTVVSLFGGEDVHFIEWHFKSHFSRSVVSTAVKIQVRVLVVILGTVAVGYQCFERLCILTKFVKRIELTFHLCMEMRKLFYNLYILGHNKTW